MIAKICSIFKLRDRLRTARQPVQRLMIPAAAWAAEVSVRSKEKFINNEANIATPATVLITSSATLCRRSRISGCSFIRADVVIGISKIMFMPLVKHTLSLLPNLYPQVSSLRDNNRCCPWSIGWPDTVPRWIGRLPRPQRLYDRQDILDKITGFKYIDVFEKI